MSDNRTTYKSNVNTDLPSASLNTAEEMRDHLKDNLSDNIPFLEDTVNTQLTITGSISVDFANYDRIDLTITGTAGSTITLNNIPSGMPKYLKITKSAAEDISFVSVSDKTEYYQSYINVSATSVLYMIMKKGTTTYVQAIEGSKAAFAAGVLEAIDEDVNSWTQPTLNTYFNHIVGNPLKYRKNSLHQLEIKGGFFMTNTVSTTPFTLPTSHRPTEIRKIIINRVDAGGNLFIDTPACHLKTNGQFQYSKPSGVAQFWPDNDIYFDINITLD